MAVPSTFADLSTTPGSNSGLISDSTAVNQIDNHLQTVYALIASIYANSGNGWSSSYLPAANPSYTGTLTGGTGVVNLGSGQLYKAAGGDVGIGTTTPSTKLTVAGGVKIGTGAATNNATLMVNTPNGTPAGIQLFQDSQESWVIQNVTSGTALVFESSGTEQVRLNNNGSFGIGTASPAGRLHVKTTSTTIPAVLDTSADTAPSYAQFRVNASAGWEVGMSQASEGYDFRWCYGAFGTGNSRLRLDSSGNLIQRLQGAVPTLNNQEAVMTFPNNSTLRITFKGTDGTSRSVDLALT